MSTDTFEIVEGRPSGYTLTGDWILLAPISDRATRVYGLLRMHCGTSSVAWPSQKTLASMLRVKKVDTVQAALKELAAIGAVDVEVVTSDRGRHNRYVVHLAPPPGYDKGPRDRSDYYAARGGVTRNQGSPEIRGHPEIRGDGSPLKTGSEGLQGEAVQPTTCPSPAAPASDLFGDSSSKPPKASTAQQADPLFEEFWKAYPRKTDKKKARAAWVRALKVVSDPRELINAAARFARSRQGEDPRFTAHPTTWLNGERWNDEPVDARRNGQVTARDAQDMRAQLAMERAARGVDGDF